MTHSNFELDAAGESFAKSYWNEREVQTLGLRDLPAGGLITTVGDLSNLIRLVNGNGIYKSRLLAPETMQEMLAIQDYNSAVEPDGFNSIGWFHFSRFLDNKYTVVGHTGQTMAHSSIVAIAPEIEKVSLAYADGVYHLYLTSPMANQDMPLRVINDAEATLQGYGRGLGETLIAQDDGSLLHAGMVLVKKE